eukprot:143119_1
MATGEGINVAEWLKQNKLIHLQDIFLSKNITIEELVDFQDNELDEFAKNILKLDILSKKRFVKAINKIKQTNVTLSTSKRHHVIISSYEQAALTKLYTKFDECSKTQILIQTSLNISNKQNKDVNQHKY